MKVVKVPGAKCPHCQGVLYTSENPNYVYQCFSCDEDFFEMEAVYADPRCQDDAMEILCHTVAESVAYDEDRDMYNEPFFALGELDAEEPIPGKEVRRWFNERYSKGAAHLPLPHGV